MAKLSDIFGRKSDTGADKFVTPLVAGSAHGHGGPTGVADYSDIGSRIGEENEALRNLLTDAGRKIGELDELKQAFDKLVVPFNGTLRALEQEKSQTLTLTARLDEARAAYETLRGEFYQIEKKATALEAESGRLRDDLELSREAVRALESTRHELAGEIKARQTQIAELERQLAQETEQRQAALEARRSLQEQFDSAEKRVIELEGEIAAARETLALLDDEKHSLQAALDQALGESARLTRRLTESENALTAMRAQLGKLEASFAETHAERGRLAAALDEAREQHLGERNSLNMRLDALQSRAATAERLLAETRQNLVARTEEVRAFDRKAVEATIARNNADKRLAQIETAHEARESQIRGLEQARLALAERNSALDKTLRAREAAVARLEEKVAALSERNGHLEADIQVSRTHIEKRVDNLNTALERERMERAVLEGALEAARKDNSRLQTEVAALRTTLRRGGQLEELPVSPAGAANDEAGSRAKHAPPALAAEAGRKE